MSLRPLHLAFLALILSECTHAPKQAETSKSTETQAAAAPSVQEVKAPAAARQSLDLSPGLASGTVIPVELRTVLDTSAPAARFAVGVVPTDVKGTDGRIALPAGSTVTMAVRDQGRNGPISAMTVSIYSVNVRGQQFSFTDGRTEAARISFREDAGMGSLHSAVHLQYGYPLNFKLDRPVQLR